MSTYQPPGEPSAYAQPQDPWASAHDTGVAAAPTDPIPQPQQQQRPGQFTPGVAAPSVWTQETIAHGGYEYVPQRSRLGMYILIILAVIVFGGGGGYGAYLLISGIDRNPGNPGGTTTAPNTSTTVATPGQSPTVAAADLKVGDCIFNSTPDDPSTPEVTPPRMIRVGCGVAGSYKIISIMAGEQIPEGPQGTFDKDNTAPQVCKGTGYEAFFAWDSPDDTKDYFFCLTTN